MNTPGSPGLSAHKGLRGQVLIELKRAQPLTAAELGRRHQVSANAVRRHLKELEAEGLVLYRREVRGQGAPVFVYRLTPEGEALFPKRYQEALSEFMSFVERSSGREEVSRFFSERFRHQADLLQAQLGDAALPERVEAVVDLLSRQGFMAEWSEQSGGVTIAEHNCAVQAVARQFPEICAAEVDFLRTVLGVAVERRAHIPAGCNACEYAVSLGDASPEAAVSPVRPGELT
jgi:DeoR family suf operon transcriptional repressor